MKLVALLILASLVSASLFEGEQNKSLSLHDIVWGLFGTEVEEVPLIEGDGVVRFFLIGDYGELGNYLAFRGVTKMMDKLASLKKYSHIITTGDNFYNDGIVNINHRFKPWAITRLLSQSYLGQLKIFPTLGNHDCHVDFTNEIKYSSINDQWEMESDYYELVTQLEDGSQKNFVNLMLNACKIL